MHWMSTNPKNYLNALALAPPMRVGGKVLGITIIAATILLLIFTVRYTQSLQEQRNASVQQLTSLPQYAECKYDASTCPQAERTVVLPDLTGVLLAFLGIVLGVYLIRNDGVQRGMLEELQSRKAMLEENERWNLVMSVLTADERKIMQAVREQPGITQATLRLRTDMSKAKLSSLLKELESRSLITRTSKGRTNGVHLKRDI